MLSLALLGAAAAYNATTTVDVTTYFTTVCSTPTTFAYAGSTYTVTEATTLTISDCGCTETPKPVSASKVASASVAAPSVAAESSSAVPVLANGAAAAKVGAAAGVAAAVAYML